MDERLEVVVVMLAHGAAGPGLSPGECWRLLDNVVTLTTDLKAVSVDHALHLHWASA